MFASNASLTPSLPTSWYRPTTRAGRSDSSVSATSTVASSIEPSRSSASSRSSSQTRSMRAVPPPAVQPQHPLYTASIDGILSRACNSSMTSLASLSLDSVRAETRPAAFSSRERSEEREIVGDAALSVLEPRDTVCWWGVGEVLQCNSLEESLIA